MKTKNTLIAKSILVLWLAATLALLFLGYSVEKPAVPQQEFPFEITYSLLGKTQTISGVYVGEYVRTAKYLADDTLAWSGYIKDHDRLMWDYYRIAEIDGRSFSIDLNLLPGYLMGDPGNAGSDCRPTLACHSFDGTNDISITDPAELETLGFSLIRWEYPQPIENRFSFGGISLSSEAAIYTSVIAVAALLACMILVRKDPALVYGKLDKLSIAVNFLILLLVFPFIFMFSVLSEIVADTSLWQQMLYLTPALTILGVSASMAMRRCGSVKYSLPAQLAAPALFVVLILITGI